METQPQPEQARIRGLSSLRGVTLVPILICFGLIGSVLLHHPESLSDRRLILPALFYGLFCALVWWLIKSNPPKMSGVKLAAFAGSVIAGASVWWNFRIFERFGSSGSNLLPGFVLILAVHIGMAASAFITYNSLKGKPSALRKLAQILVIPGIVAFLEVTMPPVPVGNMDITGERAAAASLRRIAAANVTYFQTYGQGYARMLAHLGPSGSPTSNPTSAAADLLDSVLSGVDPPAAEPVKSGYRFTYKAPNPATSSDSSNTTFSVVATPVEGGSGRSTFCLDQTNVVGRDSTGKATSATEEGCDYTAFPPL